MNNMILELKNISKTFPGVKALDNVSLSVKKGEIHALVGENGAGKSTLIKILSGIHPTGTYEGNIIVNSDEKHFYNTKDSEKCRISVIYQELALVPHMTVEENIFLGNEIKGLLGIDSMKAHAEAEKVLQEVKLPIYPSQKIIQLGIGERQLVEIAKALSKNVTLLILDEPTAALNESESANLLQILRELKGKGVTSIFISHKLEEIMDIADSITIIRDGKSIASDYDRHISRKKWDENQIISHMVGRPLTQRYPKVEHNPGNTILEVRNWYVKHKDLDEKDILKDINIRIRGGEILGIAGLMGSGRTEFATSVFGTYEGAHRGEMLLDGKTHKICSPKDAINHGIGYVTEDRKNLGLVLGMNIYENSTLASLQDLTNSIGYIQPFEELKQSKTYISKLKIKSSSIEQKVQDLSGGNQQKVVLSKWLMTNPRILFLDEPTRGIDVGAKYEIYKIMNELVQQGIAIVMISSELPEILGMSDRIVVFHEGRAVREFSGKGSNQEQIMYYATGGK